MTPTACFRVQFGGFPRRSIELDLGFCPHRRGGDVWQSVKMRVMSLVILGRHCFRSKGPVLRWGESRPDALTLFRQIRSGEVAQRNGFAAMVGGMHGVSWWTNSLSAGCLALDAAVAVRARSIRLPLNDCPPRRGEER